MGKRPPPESPPPTFFIDECIDGPSLTERLRAEGWQIETHQTAEIERGTLDADWIPDVAAREWVILSKDKFTQPGEREIITRVNAAAFVLRNRKARTAEIVETFATAMPKIVAACWKRSRPLLAFVSPSAALTIEFGDRRGAIKRD